MLNKVKIAKQHEIMWNSVKERRTTLKIVKQRKKYCRAILNNAKKAKQHLTTLNNTKNMI